MKKNKAKKVLAKGKKKIVWKSTHGSGEDFLTDPEHHGYTQGKEITYPALPKGPKVSLGERIRSVRELRGLTLEDLSSRTGIGVSTLKQIEANKLIPPLGELIKLGKALEMKMGYFISPGVEKSMTVVRADNRRPVSRLGAKKSALYGYFYESLAAEKANRFMEPFLITMVPSEIKELSTHDGQEFIFVLEGEMRAQVGDQVEILHPGDAIYYDSQVPHLVKCAGQKTTKILAVLYTGSK
ncbi:MAG: helix-turn-helix domain-containing protein [Thermodesulfobacteriota bacterium]